MSSISNSLAKRRWASRHQRGLACLHGRSVVPPVHPARGDIVSQPRRGLPVAVHPLRVESFAWVAERKDVLCALFFVSTVLLYLRFIEGPSRRGYAGWLCCGALALMSKPIAVSLPLVLLLLDYWPKRRNAKLTRLLIEKLPLASMAAVVLYLTVLGQVSSGSTSHLANVGLGVRLANAAVAYVRYLGKMLWPLNLACFYPYNPSPSALMVILAALLLCAITALAIWQRERRPWLLVGWLVPDRTPSEYRPHPGWTAVDRGSLHADPDDWNCHRRRLDGL